MNINVFSVHNSKPVQILKEMLWFTASKYLIMIQMLYTLNEIKGCFNYDTHFFV